MSSVISWIKKELVYIKNSFWDITKGFIFFLLASSGLIIAIFLRYLGFNGTVITLFGLVVEFISLSICYFLFKGYLKTKEELESIKPKEEKS
ncbi:MAG: hypothetical protein ACXABO_06765 [Promethearchaeota archaeon]|jgi:hypothetical protein